MISCNGEPSVQLDVAGSAADSMAYRGDVRLALHLLDAVPGLLQ